MSCVIADNLKEKEVKEFNIEKIKQYNIEIGNKYIRTANIACVEVYEVKKINPRDRYPIKCKLIYTSLTKKLPKKYIDWSIVIGELKPLTKENISTSIPCILKEIKRHEDLIVRYNKYAESIKQFTKTII